MDTNHIKDKERDFEIVIQRETLALQILSILAGKSFADAITILNRSKEIIETSKEVVLNNSLIPVSELIERQKADIKKYQKMAANITN